MNLICYEDYTEKLINIVLLNIPANIHYPYRTFFKRRAFRSRADPNDRGNNRAKVWHHPKGGFGPEEAP